MLSNEEQEILEPKTRVMLIIVGAMIMGATTMMLMLFVARESPKFTQELGLMTLLGIGFGLVTIVASLVAGVIQKRQAISEMVKVVSVKDGSDKDGSQKDDDSGLINKALMVYQNHMIIRCALIEGGTFFNVMMYLITGSIFNIAMFILGIVFLALNLPLPNKVISTIEWVIESAKDEKKTGF